MFSYEIYEIFKNIYFVEHLQTSVRIMKIIYLQINLQRFGDHNEL